MAILGKIRSHGIILLIVVGIALLAFVVGDGLSQGSTWLNKSQNVVVKVDGESIEYPAYQALVEQLSDVYKIQNNTNQLSEETNAQIRSQVLENYIIEKLIYSEAKKIGLVVNAEELNDRLLRNVHPIIQRLPIFADENGYFSHESLTNFLQVINQEQENREASQQMFMWKNYWLFFENLVKTNLLQEKFVAITSNAINANSLDIQHYSDLTKSTYNANYVMQPYFLVPDSTVTISENDVRALYKKRREQYKQEASRTLNYVAFNIVPSAEDYTTTHKTVNELAEEFKTIEDVSQFVKTNTDITSSEIPYSERTIPEDLKDFAFSGKVGDVNEPIFLDDIYTIARIIETGILRPDSVKLRHIFLAAENAGKTDSIVDAIKKGADFAALAQQYSVAQTAANGGEIGWMTEFDGMDKTTKALVLTAFDKKANEIFTDENVNGVQIMQVLEKTPAINKVQLATIKIKVVPSNITVSNTFNNAKQFAAELTAAEFRNRATEGGYQVLTAAELLTTAEKIANIDNSRQIIRWAFENKKDKVSDVFECGESLIVAIVTGSAEKGYRPYEDLAIQLRAELLLDKKAEKIGKTLSEHLAKNPSLEALGTAIGSEVKTAENVNFSGYLFGGAGYEPNVIGRTVASEMNKISTPIKGGAGVYVIQLISKTDNENPQTNTQIAQTINQRFSNLPYSIIEDIRKKSDIMDNRLNFY
jgi:PPIC-type PPIASE domain.